MTCYDQRGFPIFIAEVIRTYLVHFITFMYVDWSSVAQARPIREHPSLSSAFSMESASFGFQLKKNLFLKRIFQGDFLLM